jgi:retinol dehydrogenase-14
LWASAPARIVNVTSSAQAFGDLHLDDLQGRDDSGPVMRLLVPLVRPFMRSPEQGADTPVWLASAPEVEGETGGYYARRRARRSSRRSYDPELARRLWRVSEELTGLRQPA